MSDADAKARADWLERRRQYLGASDVAAVLGLSPYRGPLAVWIEKTSPVVSETKPWMRWGHLVEDAVCTGYSEITGRTVTNPGPYELQVHPDIPWLAATLDRTTTGSEQRPAPADGLGVMDAKAVGFQKAGDWEDQPPLHLQVQIAAQMACTSRKWGTLAALVGGMSIEVKDLAWDQAFWDAALPQLERFWDMVQKRIQPEADALTGTTEAIKARWAKPNGLTILGDGPTQDLADELDRARDAATTAKDRVELLSNQLRAKMGDAEFMAFGDGSRMASSIVNVKAHARASSSYRKLTRTWGRIR